MAGSVYNSTGWRAVLAAIVIVSGIGFKVWNRTPHYRTSDSGTWQVAAGNSIAYTFSAQQAMKLKIEIEPQPSEQVAVYLLDGDSHRKLQQLAAGETTDGAITPIRASDGLRQVVFEDLSLSPGSYCLVTENRDDVAVAAKFKISEYR